MDSYILLYELQNRRASSLFSREAIVQLHNRKRTLNISMYSYSMCSFQFEDG